MSDCNSIDNILKRSGTGQFQRYIDDLNPDNIELHDFKTEDWILFAYNFAKHINYFKTENSKTAFGDWQAFFDDFNINSDVPLRTTRDYKKLVDSITTVLDDYKKEGKLTPHLTLFVSFLQLFELSKKRFNGLTKRHLDFYYKEILQVDKLDFTADKVHVVFELAKRSLDTQIADSTALNAKNDANGNQLTYKTDEELIVNKAYVAALKGVYNSVNLSEFKSSAVLNTLDGFEEPLPEESPYWYPFAYDSKEENFSELPNANIGFSLASPMFDLREGLRIVEITIDFKDKTPSNTHINLGSFSTEDLLEVIKIHGSGEKKWLAPITLKNTINDKSNVSKLYETKVSQNQLKLVFQLEKDIDALVPYNQEILLENFKTSLPLFRFLIDTEKENKESIGHSFYEALIDRVVTNIKIKIDVRDAKLIDIENDFGVLKAKKPFYPFTTQPIKGSNFYVSYPEAFSKKWKNIDVNLIWKNTPDSFQELYAAYKKSAPYVAISPSNSASAIEEAFKNINVEASVYASGDYNKLKVKNDSHFKAKIDLLYKEEWVSKDTKSLFVKNDEASVFESHYSISNNFSEDIYESQIRLSLQQSFLHAEYPTLYAQALTSVANPKPPVPNEPYTPLIESITIDYTAEEVIEVDIEIEIEDYKNNRIQLFHEHPFGQSEEHQYLKTTHKSNGIIDKGDSKIIKTCLVPKYANGGEFYIGLKAVEAYQNIALLVQVLEGSENPLVDSFDPKETLDWSILCDDKWKSLEDNIISNSTNNFLSSGIIKFSVPREATETNALLPSDFVWVRARMNKDYDAVCKAINVHAQAVPASFSNNENELSHLEKGLAGSTINKLITRIPQIKSVEQPYSSFDGSPQELDTEFYRRISERLRHKNRAISLWDYEHLILQEFKEIYKVKCLNHTKSDNFISAGDVTLVVIPDTVNKNVFDIYQPRVSKALLNKVACFINQLNSMHVEAEVINPNYEEIEVTLEAKFHIGYDEKFYRSQLNQDIIKFLSPWAFDDTKEVSFGVELHQSILIDYLEKLDYVDYLQNIEIKKDNKPAGKNISPTDPKSILVSAKKHDVKPVEFVCTNSQNEEACQQ
jgi:hypothetical protein